MDRTELDYLFTKLMHGDEDAFEKIYKETKRGVFSFVYSICHDYYTAEEMMQDTYIRIRSAINTYKPGGNALAWMFTIAKNLTLNEIAKRKKEVPTDLEDPSLGPAMTYTMPEEEDQTLVNLVKKVLNEEEQQIVMLHVISGFKHKEIAEMMKKPLGTVLWAQNNALKKLKKAYEKEIGDEKQRFQKEVES